MKEFTNVFTNKTHVFTLIIYKAYNSDNIILSSIRITVKTSVISQKFLEYEDLFLTKNVRKLSKYRGSNHVIEITDNNVLSHKLLYNLLNTELAVL